MTVKEVLCRCREARENDFEQIAGLFRRSNYGLQKIEWVQWKYRCNPDGPARVFVIENSDDEIIGLRAYIPRLFESRKTGIFHATQSVDLFIAEEYRGKRLHSKLRDYISSIRGYSAVFGFPNKRSREITRTLPGDSRTYFPVDEWVYPVSMGRFLHDKPYQFLAPLVDSLSKLYTALWLGNSPKSVSIKPILRFEKDYDLDPEFIHGVRSAAYLNWRFIDNPTQDFSAHEFYDGDHGIGYCVYLLSGTACHIYDLVLSAQKRACFRLLVDRCREQGITHLHFTSVGFQLSRFGFIKRDFGAELDTCNMPQGKWLVTFADKD